MDLTQFLTPGALAIAIGAFIATFFVRKLVEGFFPWLKHNGTAAYRTKWQMWWNEVILYAIPVVFGMLVACSHSKWLFGVIDTYAGRASFGGVLGWFGDFLYECVKRALVKQLGITIPDPAAPPEPGVEGP